MFILNLRQIHQEMVPLFTPIHLHVFPNEPVNFLDLTTFYFYTYPHFSLNKDGQFFLSLQTYMTPTYTI